jgi:hypothetical protein
MSAHAAGLIIRPGPNGMRLDIRVAPRGSRTAIEGVRDGAVLVRVTAPPVDGAANAAVIAALAAALRVPRRDLRVVSGERGRRKTVEIASVSEADLRARLSAILG